MFATVRFFKKPSTDVKRLHIPRKEIFKTWNRIKSSFNEGYFNYRQLKAIGSITSTDITATANTSRYGYNSLRVLCGPSWNSLPKGIKSIDWFSLSP